MHGHGNRPINGPYFFKEHDVHALEGLGKTVGQYNYLYGS